MKKTSRKSPFIIEIFEMMNKPTEFFRKDLSIARGILYFLIANMIFTSLTQTLVYYKIIPATLKTTFIMSIVINFFSILAGFSLVSASIILLNMLIGGKNPLQIFAVLLYSMVPSLLFVWVPFIFVQSIVLFWTLALIMLGARTKEKLSTGKAVLYPVVFILLAIIITVISENYIFLGFVK